MFNFESRELAARYAAIVGNILSIIDDKDFFHDLCAITEFYDSKEDGAQVYYHLSEGWIYPATVKTMGFKRFKPWYRNTTAETSGRVIELNPKFMGRDEADQANTFVHEWLHTRGYSHGGRNNLRRNPEILKSVPYVVGQLVETFYRRKYGNR